MKTTQYIIITVADHTESELASIGNISETFLSHARYNTDKTKCIMKIISNSEGKYPSIINSITRYTIAEIADTLKSDEWIIVKCSPSSHTSEPGILPST